MNRQQDREENIQKRTVAEEVSETAEDGSRKAIAKAMQLLLYRQRTEKELRDKLREKEFSEQDVEAAVRYVSSFGYLNDRRYAEVYLHSRKGRAGRHMIVQELQEKGICREWIDELFETEEYDEGETIYALLCKRAGQPHPLQDKEC